MTRAGPSAAPFTMETIQSFSVKTAAETQRSAPLSARALQGLQEMFLAARDALQDSSHEAVVKGIASALGWVTRRVGELLTLPPASVDATTRQRLENSRPRRCRSM